MPYAVSRTSYDLTPRLVSYFEVTVLPASDDQDGAQQTGIRAMQNQPECVAIGLADSEFPIHRSMPGWDVHSFGYHSDDGGFYHGDGFPREEDMPTFGAGDCVGCGIDYERNALFFCKNGEFLGYAAPLTEEQTDREWFPVVGLDSRCPVSCNFGTSSTPFQFDLTGLVEQQQEAIASALRETKSEH